MTTVEYPNSYNNVFNAVLQAIADCSFRKESIDMASGRIVASTDISLWSWGESIELQVSEADNGATVSISSTPNAQIIDWGKSEDNIERLFAAIERHL
ncbi:MAG: hypothetical protein SYNGOMJ08_00247 [Candidatus Syntrophoarchaeum sp. GoM_oil]|nr:MAG: hypothetical protein SYNGOMJ08_00247 [Candidatus Syntrophoarchaeum sp. GoM_oil]